MRFEELLSEETYALAWRHCCSLCPSRADAEDLLQEALYQALQRIEQLRNPAAFRSWLLAIIRRRFLNKQRHTQREHSAINHLGQAQADTNGFAAPQAAEAVTAEQELALLALAGMQESQRSMLSLFYSEGLSMQEIARCFGLSALVVQGRLARARAAFKRRMLELEPRLQPAADRLKGGADG